MATKYRGSHFKLLLDISTFKSKETNETITKTKDKIIICANLLKISPEKLLSLINKDLQLEEGYISILKQVGIKFPGLSIDTGGTLGSFESNMMSTLTTRKVGGK